MSTSQDDLDATLLFAKAMRLGLVKTRRGTAEPREETHYVGHMSMWGDIDLRPETRIYWVTPIYEEAEIDGQRVGRLARWERSGG